MATFNSMESAWLEPDDPPELPELPEGWWDEDRAGEATAILKAVLIFHSGGEWSDEKRTEWCNTIQSPDATTKTLCNAIRAFLDGKVINPTIHDER